MISLPFISHDSLFGRSHEPRINLTFAESIRGMLIFMNQGLTMNWPIKDKNDRESADLKLWVIGSTLHHIVTFSRLFLHIIIVNLENQECVSNTCVLQIIINL